MEQMSPLLQARLEQQQAYQTQNNTNPFVSTPKVNIGGAKLEQLDKDTVSLSSNNNSEFDYSIDDGKISFGDKLKNFGKGLITPITALFSSPKNFLIGAGIIAAGTALTIATGGAIAPLFVALGVTGGAIQLGTSIVKAHNATTDDEAKSAWLGMGAGTSAVGMSVLGSKAALKGAGVDTKGMSFLKSTVECFRQVPSSVSKSVSAFTSGQALTNIKNVFKPKKTANTETNSESKAEPKAEPKTEQNIESKTEAKTEAKSEVKVNQQTEQTKATEVKEQIAEPKAKNSTTPKPEAKAEPKAEPKTEQNIEPKTETKVEAQAEQPKAPEVNETACETKVEPKQETSKTTTKPKTETPEAKPEIKKPAAEVKTEQKNIMLDCTEKEAIAVAKYKYGSDQEINQSLRFGKATDETISKIRTLDEIYDGVMPSESEQTLYRGVHIRQNSKYANTLKNLKVGDTLSEDAYLSTTSDYSTAQNFADGENGYIFKIKMPKGSKTIDIESYRGIETFDKNIPSNMKNESEFLLQRGSNLKISSIDRSGKQAIIECEYIGSTPKEVSCVSLNTAEEILNFKLEKIFANPDAADDGYIASAIQECAKAGRQRSDDITKLIQLFKDRVSYTQDPTKFSELIGNKSNNILSYYDNNGNYEEMIDLLKYMESNSKSGESFINIGGNISAALQEGLELSTPCLKSLIEADFLPKSWEALI